MASVAANNPLRRIAAHTAGTGCISNRHQAAWQYAQVVEQRENGRVAGMDYRPIYGDSDELLTNTVYVEHTNLTSRHINGRLVRKTLRFSCKFFRTNQ